MKGRFLATSLLSSLWSSPLSHTLTLASSSFSLGDGGGKPHEVGVPPAGMGWLDVPRDFLRQRPVDGGPRVILVASLQCQVPVAWLSLVRTEAKVPYLPPHELAGCNSGRPATHPSA